MKIVSDETNPFVDECNISNRQSLRQKAHWLNGVIGSLVIGEIVDSKGNRHHYASSGGKEFQCFLDERLGLNEVLKHFPHDDGIEASIAEVIEVEAPTEEIDFVLRLFALPGKEGPGFIDAGFESINADNLDTFSSQQDRHDALAAADIQDHSSPCLFAEPVDSALRFSHEASAKFAEIGIEDSVFSITILLCH